MGKIKRKPFREPREYYKMYFWYSVAIIMILWVIVDLAFFTTEVEAYAHFGNRKLIGDSMQRLSILLQKILVNKFGKMGLVAVLSIILMGLIYHLYEEIVSYRYFKKKCRLYQAGLIANFYDIYDDHERLLARSRIRRLFSWKKKLNSNNKNLYK